MDAQDVIQRRRTVRDFTGPPIPRIDLETILDMGRLAPTTHNR